MTLNVEHRQIEFDLRRLGNDEPSAALIHGLMVLAFHERLDLISKNVVLAYLAEKGLGKNLKSKDQQDAFVDLVDLLVQVVNRTRQKARYLDD